MGGGGNKAVLWAGAVLAILGPWAKVQDRIAESWLPYWTQQEVALTLCNIGWSNCQKPATQAWMMDRLLAIAPSSMGSGLGYQHPGGIWRCPRIAISIWTAEISPCGERAALEGRLCGLYPKICVFPQDLNFPCNGW